MPKKRRGSGYGKSDSQRMRNSRYFNSIIIFFTHYYYRPTKTFFRAKETEEQKEKRLGTDREHKRDIRYDIYIFLIIFVFHKYFLST